MLTGMKTETLLSVREFADRMEYYPSLSKAFSLAKRIASEWNSEREDCENEPGIYLPEVLTVFDSFGTQVRIPVVVCVDVMYMRNGQPEYTDNINIALLDSKGYWHNDIVSAEVPEFYIHDMICKTEDMYTDYMVRMEEYEERELEKERIEQEEIEKELAMV